MRRRLIITLGILAVVAVMALGTVLPVLAHGEGTGTLSATLENLVPELHPNAGGVSVVTEGAGGHRMRVTARGLPGDTMYRIQVDYSGGGQWMIGTVTTSSGGTFTVVYTDCLVMAGDRVTVVELSSGYDGLPVLSGVYQAANAHDGGPPCRECLK